MISVVIPALNEAATIQTVVRLALHEPAVTEVIVIDDGSIDRTAQLAREAGARVITSSMLGKGASMRDGLAAAHEDLLVYLDGDLWGLQQGILAALSQPLLRERADLVKASFTRRAGRVTTLTARPLLQTFFPELSHIDQPLGGIIAGRRSLLQRLHFEDDYGVDVGLLLDAWHVGARVMQVQIGHLEHDSHPLEQLGEMATQVTRVILNRAARFGRLRVEQIQQVQESERHMQARVALLAPKLKRTGKLALLDMDGVLLNGRFIVELARHTHKTSLLAQYLDHQSLSAESRTRFIASLFKGVTKNEFIAAAKQIPLIPDAAETVIELRKRGYQVGIVTDSFLIAAEIVRRRVFADFCIAHVMHFRNEKATGEITLSTAMTTHPNGCQQHRLCKLNVLHHLTEQSGFELPQVIAAGDGENDVCLLRAVSQSFAFQPKTTAVAAAARHVIAERLSGLLEFLPRDQKFPRLEAVPSNQIYSAA